MAFHIRKAKQILPKTQSMATAKTYPVPRRLRATCTLDCWCVPNALEVLSARPSLIRKLFVVTGQENVGRYCLKFYRRGEWKLVYVDSAIPCHRSGMPAFTHGDATGIWIDSFTWPALVEKGLAKLHGSYRALEASIHDVANALEDMTEAYQACSRCTRLVM